MSIELIERIDQWARLAPERVAHVSAGRRLTYGELACRSDALAAHLARALPDDHSPLAVLGHKEPEVLIAFLGAIKSGHPYVPIDTITPPQRVARTVELSGARLMLTPELVAQYSAQPAPAPQRCLDANDAYYILFTSGSTGEPKGVVITLGNVSNFLNWVLSQQDFVAQQEVFLNQVLYSFDVSAMDTYLALLMGGTVWSITRDEVANPKQLYQAFGASGTSIFVCTPSFAQMCLVERSFNQAMLPRLRRFFIAGEALAPEIVAQLLDRFPNAEVWNGYGPTEATVIVTWVNITRELLGKYASLPIGYAMAHNRLVVMNENHVAADGERGEIVIAGPSVSPGYLGRPDLSEKVFFELDGARAYRTGDWGHWRDGMLFYEGRIDNQIKLYGYRIELPDIEANLRALHGVMDAVVVPVMKHGRTDSLAAFVILNERPSGSDFEVVNQLRAHLAERLPAYMLPRKFRFVETFPMNANGKADRRKLAELV